MPRGRWYSWHWRSPIPTTQRKLWIVSVSSRSSERMGVHWSRVRLSMCQMDSMLWVPLSATPRQLISQCEMLFHGSSSRSDTRTLTRSVSTAASGLSFGGVDLLGACRVLGEPGLPSGVRSLGAFLLGDCNFCAVLANTCNQQRMGLSPFEHHRMTCTIRIAHPTIMILARGTRPASDNFCVSRVNDCLRGNPVCHASSPRTCVLFRIRTTRAQVPTSS